MNDNSSFYNNNSGNQEQNRGQMAVGQTMAPTQEPAGGNGALHWLDEADVQDLRSRWTNIQAGFVDEPRSAVSQADALVADTMERIQKGFTSKRSLLDKHWNSNEDVSTEDLRTILQDYRSFFNRLLAL
jgi:hypothetical protein